MEFVKTVSDDGKIELLIDGGSLDFELSRKLTGTTCETHEGIFITGSQERFFFGDFSGLISFSGQIEKQWLADDLLKEINDRIAKVRDWVADCKGTAGEGKIVVKVKDRYLK